MFVWYWLSDGCSKEKIPYVLGHALYMKAIHGGKSKNDKIDSKKIATLLRGGNIPVAYVYPKKMRSTRDLLRRRNHLMSCENAPNSSLKSKTPIAITICVSAPPPSQAVTGTGNSLKPATVIGPARGYG